MPLPDPLGARLDTTGGDRVQRRGCGGVTATRPQDGVRPEPAELVTAARATLALARRAPVLHGGRIVRLLAAAPGRGLARAVRTLSRDAGFGRRRPAAAGPATMLTAALPCMRAPHPAAHATAQAA